MPNWSHNSCTVTGPETDIKAMFDLMVVKRDSGDEFDFNHIMPMPQSLRDLTLMWSNNGLMPHRGELDDLVPVEKQELDDWRAKYGTTNWYDWACNNWGTNRNASNFSSNYDGGPSATFEFNTAWAFPNPIAKALSEKFPSLRFVWKVFNEGWIQDPEYRGDDCEYHGGRLVSANWYERPFA